MTTSQGDTNLLQHPIAQGLLQSNAWARLAYVWTDGTPRVVPMGFHWNGSEIVFGTAPDAPKMKALRNGAKVALTIERENPTHVLMIRGSVRVETIDGIVPEYASMVRRMLGAEQGPAFLTLLEAGLPQMSRISITPEWVGVLDFETRSQHWLEQVLERAAPTG